MTRLSALTRLAALAAASLALSSCISLLPKAEPSTLYSFGRPPAAETPAAEAGVASSRGVVVYRAPGQFQRASAGDRILTVTAARAAYVAETRWVSPASILWDEAVVSAFDGAPGPSRLVVRGELAPTAAYVLRLDVRSFETRYDRGAKAAPLVTVRVRGTLTRNNDRLLVSDRMFEKEVRAGDNRMGAIIPAYDRAVADVLGEIVAWTNAEAKPL